MKRKHIVIPATAREIRKACKVTKEDERKANEILQKTCGISPEDLLGGRIPADRPKSDKPKSHCRHRRDRDYGARFCSACGQPLSIPPARRDEAIDCLKRFWGMPPYHGGSNAAVGDSFYAQDIVQKFKMPIDELADVTGMKQLKFDFDLTMQHWSGRKP